MEETLKALARAGQREYDKQMNRLAFISKRECLMYYLASEQEQEWWNSLTDEQQQLYINQTR